MQFSTSLLPQLQAASHQADVAVVIDVLRATSVMATALQAGATSVVTCREIDEASQLAERFSPRALLCGERGCRPIDGFDLGNSPAEYTPDFISGKSLVLTTTNGTRAIEAAKDAAETITAAFLNISAVVEFLRGAHAIHLVCAGTENQITGEDVLLAGAILSECETRYGAAWRDDDSTLACQLWRSWFPGPTNSSGEQDQHRSPQHVTAHELSLRLRETRGGRNLIKVGYEQDLDRCSAIDAVSIVPQRVLSQPTTFQIA